MKAVEMPLVEHDTCQAALQETRLGPNFLLHHSFLCAGGQKEGQDSCTGDGGSPLVCPSRSDSTRYVQVRGVTQRTGFSLPVRCTAVSCFPCSVCLCVHFYIIHSVLLHLLYFSSWSSTAWLLHTLIYF